MIKRLSVFATVTDASGTRANVPAGQDYVCVAELTANRWLCKQTLPDGTSTTTGWLVDVTMTQDADGNWQQTDIDTATLTNSQLNTIKTWLTNQGLSVSDLAYSAVKDRKALLVYLLRKLAWWAGWDAVELRRLLLDGFDVG